MIEMQNWASKAVAKLESELKKVSGQKEKVMANAVLDTIKDFCLQDEEFAQAVVQGGTFDACMKKVASGVGNCISDIDAYKKAVQFYFPGAKVTMQLSIDLIGDAAKPTAEEQKEKKQEKASAMVLSLSDFF